MIDGKELFRLVSDSLPRRELHKVLIIPPDYTRLYSGAGIITQIYYSLLHESCQVDIMPALGTHVPMSRSEWTSFFGDIPFDRMIVHSWRTDVEKIGEVPSDFVREVSGGLVDDAIDVQVNRRVLDKSYDLVISVGQVVPHEVVGMSGYSKNIFVGCGGSSMINSSHMLGAFYGMERIMGLDHSPVRKVFDYAEHHFLSDIPLLYVLTVTTNKGDETLFHGVFIGRDRKIFESAVALAQEKNMIGIKNGLQKVVVYLDPREFKSTWLGNKAIYRTRMAINDGGELIVLAPGVDRFGEDPGNDRLIRKYGYVGRDAVLELVKREKELKENLSVAAHLIHGSSDGRFKITYCTRALSRQEVEGVGFGYKPYDEIVKLYNPDVLKDGYCTVGGEQIFYISNPALGLWKKVM